MGFCFVEIGKDINYSMVKMKDKIKTGILNIFESFQKAIRFLIKVWLPLVLKPQSFLLIVLGIFLIQFVESKNWLKAAVGNFNNFGWFVSALIGAFFIDCVYNSKVYRLCKVKDITRLDVSLYDTLIISLINWLIFYSKKLPNSEDIIFWLFISSFISLLGIIVRSIFILSFKKPNINNQSKLYDLTDLLDGPISSDSPIFIDERPSSVDLFNRKNTMAQLKNAIALFSPKHSYVVGLVGKWGIGKTTLLDLVKKDFSKDDESDTVFINAPGDEKENFDLWLFGSKDQMIKGFYDTFMYNLNANYNSSAGRNILRSGSQVLTGIPQVGNLFKFFTSDSGSYYDVNQIKKELTGLIKKTGKHYVMCIENLDRANKKQVILLLKVLNTIFDLPYVTYVLLYDKERLNSIMESKNKINANFAEKVINQEIEVPTVLDREICFKVLKNLLRSYDIPRTELSEYDYVLNEIINNLDTVRELKRIINSAFTILAIKDGLRLNLPQVLAIQYIQMANKSLYEEIRTHKNFFIFKDISVEDIDTYSIKATNEDYLNQLLSKDKNIRFTQLLSNVFIKIKMLEENKNSETFEKIVFDKKLQAVSIDTAKYFDNYFALSENDYVQINTETRYFINEVNKNNDIQSSWKEYIVNKSMNEKEDYSLELTLFVKKEDITSSPKREQLAEIMWHSIRDNYKYEHWDELSLERILQCIIDLVGEISEKDFEKFGNMLSDYYNSLNIIREISNEMEYRLGSISSEFKNNSNKIRKLYYQICDKVLGEKNGINLFDSKYYVRMNINGLVYYPNHSSEVKEYIGRSINFHTIYNVLQDAVDYTGQDNDNHEVIGGLFAEALKENKAKVEKSFKSSSQETKEEKKLHNKYIKFSKSLSNKQNADDNTLDDLEDFNLESSESNVDNSERS